MHVVLCLFGNVKNIYTGTEGNFNLEKVFFSKLRIPEYKKLIMLNCSNIYLMSSNKFFKDYFLLILLKGFVFFRYIFLALYMYLYVSYKHITYSFDLRMLAWQQSNS